MVIEVYHKARKTKSKMDYKKYQELVASGYASKYEYLGPIQTIGSKPASVEALEKSATSEAVIETVPVSVTAQPVTGTPVVLPTVVPVVVSPISQDIQEGISSIPVIPVEIHTELSHESDVHDDDESSDEGHEDASEKPILKRVRRKKSEE